MIPIKKLLPDDIFGNMKLDVAVLAGGDSGEYEVSLASADMIMRSLDPNLFRPWLVHVQDGKFEVRTEHATFPLHSNFFGFEHQGELIRFAVAYNMVHGAPGENGVLQGWLEMNKVPYTTPGVMASALTMNKHLSKVLVQSLGIPVAKGILMLSVPSRTETETMVKELGLPCFVKPNCGGSSVATFKVKEAGAFREAVEAAIQVDGQVLAETYLPGKELSVGIMETKGKLQVLPCTEIVPHGEFFDYEAKYKGASDEITPARISDDVRARLEEKTKAIYRLLNLRGLVRIDFIYSENTLYFMEVNTIPGFSPASLVPQQLRCAGLDVREVLTDLIYAALNREQPAGSAK